MVHKYRVYKGKFGCAFINCLAFKLYYRNVSLKKSKLWITNVTRCRDKTTVVGFITYSATLSMMGSRNFHLELWLYRGQVVAVSVIYTRWIEPNSFTNGLDDLE